MQRVLNVAFNLSGVVLPVLIVGLTLVVSGGCRASANDRMTLAERVYLPAFTAGEAGEAVQSDLQDDERSVTSFDRSHWESSLVLVPLDITYHEATFTTTQRLTDATARQRAEFPTEHSALETGAQRYRQQFGESVFGPMLAALDVVCMPYNYFRLEGWRPARRSPDLLYERRPRPRPETDVGMKPWSARGQDPS